MDTLGINAAYHDPAACLVRDGRVIAAAEEERFTHINHGKRPVPFSTWELPFHAIDYCLREADIRLVDLDHVAYSYDPYLLLGRHGGAWTFTLPRGPPRAPPPLGGGGDAAGPAPAGWESRGGPLFLCSIGNARGQLVDGAPHHLRDRFRGAKS